MGKQRHTPSLVLERICRSRTDKEIIVIGIDEVGTGAYAGPIVVGAVAFKDDESKIPIDVRDSKMFNTHEERQVFIGPIYDSAIMVGIGITTPDEINEWGSAKAREVAIIRAFKDAKKRYNGLRVVAVVDGRNLKKMRKKLGGACAVFADRADQKSYSVAAASLVAKVTRDSIMRECAITYPGYSFETNVGYGTNEHMKALRKIGICNIHRVNVKPIKKMLEENEKNKKKDIGTKSKTTKTRKSKKTS